MEGIATNTTGNNTINPIIYGGHALNICGSLHTIYNTLTSWTNFCGTCESVTTKLSNISKYVNLPTNATKPMKITSTAFEDVKKMCADLTKYGDNYCNLSAEVEEALGKGVSRIDRAKLDESLRKLESTIKNQLQMMLIGEIIKTAGQTTIMLGSLFETCRLVRASRQFRESTDLRLTIGRIENHLAEAEQFWNLANNAIVQIGQTPNVHPTTNTLQMIHFNLRQAKFENDCARKELEFIMKDIKHHLEKLSSNRTSHAVGIAQSALSFGASAFQFVQTPAFMLSNLARNLFIANFSLQAVNVVGHSLGCYWSHEEIHRLEEQKKEMDNLDGKIKDGYQKIDYAMGKLKNIEQRNATTTDFTNINEDIVE